MGRDRVTRGRPSRIEGLPDAIRDAIDRALRSGLTQAEILRRINPDVEAAGEAPISRSGLGRYASGLAEDIAAAGAEIRQTRAATQALIAQFGERPAGEIGALNIEILRTMATRAVLRAREAGLDPETDLEDLIDMVGDLARAIDRMERASATTARREQALREAFAAEAADRAAEAAETAARESGHALPAEVLARIRRDVYGIRDAA